VASQARRWTWGLGLAHPAWLLCGSSRWRMLCGTQAAARHAREEPPLLQGCCSSAAGLVAGRPDQPVHGSSAFGFCRAWGDGTEPQDPAVCARGINGVADAVSLLITSSFAHVRWEVKLGFQACVISPQHISCAHYCPSRRAHPHCLHIGSCGCR
jgi:hypothetical protein